MTCSPHCRQGHFVKLPYHARYILVDRYPRTPASFYSHSVVFSVPIKPKKSAGDGNDSILVTGEVKHFQACVDQVGKVVVGGPGLDCVVDDLGISGCTSEQGVQKRVSLN